MVCHHQRPELFNNNKNMEIVINDNLEQWRIDCLKLAFEKANILDKNNYIKYSLSGWYVFGISAVFKELIESIEVFYIKKLWESASEICK